MREKYAIIGEILININAGMNNFLTFNNYLLRLIETFEKEKFPENIFSLKTS